MRNWPTARLSDVATIHGGNSAPQGKDSFKNGVIPFIRTSDVGSVHIGELGESRDRLPLDAISKFKVFEPGAVLMPKSGASTFTNHRVITTAPAAVSSHLAVIVSDPSVMDSRFCFYALQQIDARNLVQDQSYPSLGLKEIALIEIPLPPLDEQKRIVAKLDEMTSLLKDLQSKSVQSASQSRDLDDALIDSLVPSNSTLIALTEVCDFQGGTQPPKAQFISDPRKGYTRFIQIRDFESDSFVTYIPTSPKNRTCVASDVLLGRYGASVGRVCRGLEGAYNVALVKVVPNPQLVSADYIEIFLRSRKFQKPLRMLSSRSAQNGFNKEDLSKIMLPLPSLRQQQDAVAKYQSVVALRNQIDEKAQCKSQLIHALETSMRRTILDGPSE